LIDHSAVEGWFYEQEEAVEKTTFGDREYLAQSTRGNINFPPAWTPCFVQIRHPQFLRASKLWVFQE
jgi:hypothetical protein